MKKIRLERLNDGKPAIWETCGKRVTVICDNAGRYIYPFYITNTKSKNYIFLIPVKKDDIVVILYSSKYGSLIIEVFQIINFCKENKKEYALLRKISYYKEGKTNNEGILVKYIKSILTAISIFYENKRGKNERIKMEPKDYKNRAYLSAIEAAKFLGISVEMLHSLANREVIKTQIAASGQMRFDLKELKEYDANLKHKFQKNKIDIEKVNVIEINGTTQKIFIENSMKMDDLTDNSIHLMITSPPYFDTKMYSREPIPDDLGNIHDIDGWFEKVSVVWKEVYRVLQPGRKAFINIMNLPIRLENGRFRTLNLVGRTIDTCEKIGFIFKRDIVWHKTNAVRAHFGTYPYPGGILINNMHEFILEFDKPEKKGFNKYGHLTKEQKEQSKLDKEFWLSIKKSDVWVMKPQGSGDRRNHVAPFPYELPFRLIKAFSYIGETILDPFVGCGTTLLASADLKRNGMGYEINSDIAFDAVKSLRNYQTKLW